MQKATQQLKELTRSEKRVVSKLIKVMHEKNFDESSRRALNRQINHVYKKDNEQPSRRPNGYLVFYKEKFPKLQKEGKTILEAGRFIGEKWRNLSQEEKDAYKEKSVGHG